MTSITLGLKGPSVVHPVNPEGKPSKLEAASQAKKTPRATFRHPQEIALFKEMKIDQQGCVTPLAKPPGPMTGLSSPQTLGRLKDVMTRPVKVFLRSLNVEFEIPAQEITSCVLNYCHAIQEKYPNEKILEWFRLIGGNASYVLEENLNERLQDFSPQDFSKGDKLNIVWAADRDLQIKISAAHTDKLYGLEGELIEKVLLPHLLQKCPDIKTDQAKSILKLEGFKKKSAVNLKENKAEKNLTPSDRFVNLSIGDFEIGFGVEYLRTNLFERDYPQVDLIPYFKNSNAPVQLALTDPQRLIQAALDRKFKRIHFVEPEKLTHKHWLYSISLIAKGYTPPSSKFMDTLKQKYLEGCRKETIYQLAVASSLTNFFDSHYKDDPQGALTMKAIAFFALSDTFSPEELKSLWGQAVLSKSYQRENELEFEEWLSLKESFDRKTLGKSKSNPAHIPHAISLWISQKELKANAQDPLSWLHALNLQSSGLVLTDPILGAELRTAFLKSMRSSEAVAGALTIYLATYCASDPNAALALKFNTIFDLCDNYSEADLYALWLHSPLPLNAQRELPKVHPILDALDRALRTGELTVKACKGNLALLSFLSHQFKKNPHCELRCEALTSQERPQSQLVLNSQQTLLLPFPSSADTVQCEGVNPFGGPVSEHLLEELIAGPADPAAKQLFDTLDLPTRNAIAEKLLAGSSSSLIEKLRYTLLLKDAEIPVECWGDLLSALIEKDHKKIDLFRSLQGEKCCFPLDNWKKLSDKKNLLQTVLSAMAMYNGGKQWKEVVALWKENCSRLPEAQRQEVTKALYMKALALSTDQAYYFAFQCPEVLPLSEPLTETLKALHGKSLSSGQWEQLTHWSKSVAQNGKGPSDSLKKEMGTFLKTSQGTPESFDFLIACTQNGFYKASSPKTTEIWVAHCEESLLSHGLLSSWQIFAKALELGVAFDNKCAPFILNLSKACLDENHPEIYSSLIPAQKKHLGKEALNELKKLELKNKKEITLSEFDDAYSLDPTSAEDILSTLLHKQIERGEFKETAAYLIKKQGSLSPKLMKEVFPLLITCPMQALGYTERLALLRMKGAYQDRTDLLETVCAQIFKSDLSDQEKTTFCEEAALKLTQGTIFSPTLLKIFSQVLLLPLPVHQIGPATIKKVVKNSLLNPVFENPEDLVVIVQAAVQNRFPLTLSAPVLATYFKAILPLSDEAVGTVATVLAQHDASAIEVRSALIRFYLSHEMWPQLKEQLSWLQNHSTDADRELFLSSLPILIEKRQLALVKQIIACVPALKQNWCDILLRSADQMSGDDLRESMIQLIPSFTDQLLPLWQKKYASLLDPNHAVDYLSLLSAFNENKAQCWQPLFEVVTDRQTVEAAWAALMQVESIQGDKSGCVIAGIKKLKAFKSDHLLVLMSDTSSLERIFLPVERRDFLRVFAFTWKAVCESVSSKKEKNILVEQLWKARDQLKRMGGEPDPAAGIQLARMFLQTPSPLHWQNCAVELLEDSLSLPMEDPALRDALALVIPLMKVAPKTLSSLGAQIVKKLHSGLILHLDPLPFLKSATVNEICPNEYFEQLLLHLLDQNELPYERHFTFKRQLFDFVFMVLERVPQYERKMELLEKIYNHPKFSHLLTEEYTAQCAQTIFIVQSSHSAEKSYPQSYEELQWLLSFLRKGFKSLPQTTVETITHAIISDAIDIVEKIEEPKERFAKAQVLRHAVFNTVQKEPDDWSIGVPSGYADDHPLFDSFQKLIRVEIHSLVKGFPFQEHSARLKGLCDVVKRILPHVATVEKPLKGLIDAVFASRCESIEIYLGNKNKDIPLVLDQAKDLVSFAQAAAGHFSPDDTGNMLIAALKMELNTIECFVRADYTKLMDEFEAKVKRLHSTIQGSQEQKLLIWVNIWCSQILHTKYISTGSEAVKTLDAINSRINIQMRELKFTGYVIPDVWKTMSDIFLEHIEQGAIRDKSISKLDAQLHLASIYSRILRDVHGFQTLGCHDAFPELTGAVSELLTKYFSTALLLQSFYPESLHLMQLVALERLILEIKSNKAHILAKDMTQIIIVSLEQNPHLYDQVKGIWEKGEVK